MINASTVSEWFIQAEENEELYPSDIAYANKGDSIEFDSLPEEVTLKVVETNTERDHDSYGYSSVNDGFIVFSVNDAAGNVQNFKLPVTYSSYEGWSYDTRGIVAVMQREKVITTWEWA